KAADSRPPPDGRARTASSAWSCRHLRMLGVSAAGGTGQRRGAGLAQVSKSEFFQADRMRFPTGWHWVVCLVLPDEQLCLGSAARRVHDAQAFGIPLGFDSGAGEQAVAGKQVLDLAGYLYPSPRDRKSTRLNSSH